MIIEFDPTVNNVSDGMPLEYINGCLEREYPLSVLHT